MVDRVGVGELDDLAQGITAMRSETCLTTARSWAMKM